ncbi:response regulator transcription factor [Spongisporangium articulatum]|uniref:Response regulator transcription factor n=1 Tax=Spongisporangium articulatum TaxID=3362603 RepID=A0ABW8AU38_9ACTN
MDDSTGLSARSSRGRRALVIDDEIHLASMIAGYLRREGFDVDLAGDGQQALDKARAEHPDLVILDLGLPELDGVELCRELRTFSDCYVIMVTARAGEADKLRGLAAGADDYITKPFSPRELVARVEVMFRRPRSGRPVGDLVIGDLTIDRPRREVRLAGAPLELTPIEFDVLAALGARRDTVLTRRQILDIVWGESWVGDENLVDVHIGHLRRKLSDGPGNRRYLHTVRGVGFRIGE